MGKVARQRVIRSKMKIPGFKTNIYFDLETNGCLHVSLTSKFHKIVQMAAVTSCGEEFNEIIDPKVHIPMESTEIHNISNGDVEGKMDFSDGFKRFVEYVNRFETPILIAHNAFRFDKVLLEKECREAGLDKEFNNLVFFDTLPFFRCNFSKLTSFKLGALYKHFTSLELEGAHDALVDVKGLREVFEAVRIPVGIQMGSFILTGKEHPPAVPYLSDIFVFRDGDKVKMMKAMNLKKFDLRRNYYKVATKEFLKVVFGEEKPAIKKVENFLRYTLKMVSDNKVKDALACLLGISILEIDLEIYFTERFREKCVFSLRQLTKNGIKSETQFKEVCLFVGQAGSPSLK